LVYSFSFLDKKCLKNEFLCISGRGLQPSVIVVVVTAASAAPVSVVVRLGSSG
jgi:hypothetical protein